MTTPANASVSNVDISNIMPNGSGEPPADPAAEPTATPEAPTEKPVAEAPPEQPSEAPAELKIDADEPPLPVEVPKTGYDEFDTVGALLAEKGLAEAPEIMDAFLETGELSLEHKAKMIEALGEGVAAMAFKQMEGTAKNIISEAKAESQKTMDYANEKFNGADGATTWKQIQEYVRTPESGFSEADRATMNDMLAQGGLAAQLVIDKVHAVYTNDSTKSQPGTLLEGDSASNGLTFEPISRADYTAAMGKAVREHGDDSPQVRELDARRMKSIELGY